MTQTYTSFDSPLGELIITVDSGKVTGLYQPNQPNTPLVDDLGVRDESLRYHPVASALHRYFMDGSVIKIPTAQKGTALQQKVWKAIQDIPYGKTKTYKELAEMVGSPKAVRAVASAVASNAVTVIVPCHRVVSQNGDVKYSGGETNKRYLLRLEETHPQYED